MIMVTGVELEEPLMNISKIMLHLFFRLLIMRGVRELKYCNSLNICCVPNVNLLKLRRLWCLAVTQSVQLNMTFSGCGHASRQRLEMPSFRIKINCILVVGRGV